MDNDFSYLDEAAIIRRAEQERSKVIAEFLSGMFSRDKRAVAPTHAVAAE